MKPTNHAKSLLISACSNAFDDWQAKLNDGADHEFAVHAEKYLRACGAKDPDQGGLLFACQAIMAACRSNEMITTTWTFLGNALYELGVRVDMRFPAYED